MKRYLIERAGTEIATTDADGVALFTHAFFQGFGHIEPDSIKADMPPVMLRDGDAFVTIAQIA